MNYKVNLYFRLKNKLVSTRILNYRSILFLTFCVTPTSKLVSIILIKVKTVNFYSIAVAFSFTIYWLL